MRAKSNLIDVFGSDKCLMWCGNKLLKDVHVLCEAFRGVKNWKYADCVKCSYYN